MSRVCNRIFRDAFLRVFAVEINFHDTLFVSLSPLSLFSLSFSLFLLTYVRYLYSNSYFYQCTWWMRFRSYLIAHTRERLRVICISRWIREKLDESKLRALFMWVLLHTRAFFGRRRRREREERKRERERRARCERGTEIQSARNHVTGFPFATIETLRGRSIRGSSYLFDPCSRIFLLSKYLYHFFSCYLRTRSRLLRLFSESCVQSRVIGFIR